MTYTEQVVFTGHSAFQVNTRYGAKTKNVFTDQQGREFQVWKQDIAAQLLATMGQTVTVNFEAKQNGSFTNYDVQSVGLPAGAVQQSAPPPQAAPAQTAPPPQQTVTQVDKDARITRAAALDRALTAFGIEGLSPIANQAALIELSEEYVSYLRDGAETTTAAPVAAAGPTV